MRLELRTFRHNDGIKIDHLPTAIAHQLIHALQEDDTISPFPLIIRWREIVADISERQRPEHGIHDRVSENIRITMTDQTQLMLDRDAPED
jgi:hypothetical protein